MSKQNDLQKLRSQYTRAAVIGIPTAQLLRLMLASSVMRNIRYDPKAFEKIIRHYKKIYGKDFPDIVYGRGKIPGLYLHPHKMIILPKDIRYRSPEVLAHELGHFARSAKRPSRVVRASLPILNLYEEAMASREAYKTIKRLLGPKKARQALKLYTKAWGTHATGALPAALLLSYFIHKKVKQSKK